MEGGEKFYNIYVKAVGGKNFKGDPCPTFSELDYKQKYGWACVAIEKLSKN